jgi:hypothetical protein
MEMSGQIRAPVALAAGMNAPTYRIGSRGYIADLDALGRQKITYLCPFGTPDYPARSCRPADYAVPFLRRDFYFAVCVPLVWH